MNHKTMPPHNPELEKAVLNAWLSGECPSSRPPERSLFWNPAHREIITAIWSLHQNKEKIDLVSVLTHIETNIKNPNTSPALLGEITTGLIASSSYDTNVRQLEDLSLRRQMVQLIEQGTDSVNDDSFPRVVAHLTKEFRDIQRRQQTYTASTGFPNFVRGVSLVSAPVVKPPEIIEGILRQGRKMVFLDQQIQLVLSGFGELECHRHEKPPK